MIYEQEVNGYKVKVFKPIRLIPYYDITAKEISDLLKSGAITLLEEINPDCKIGVEIEGKKRGIVKLPIHYTGIKNKRRKEVLKKCQDFRFVRKVVGRGQLTKQQLIAFQTKHRAKYPMTPEEEEYELDETIKYLQDKEVLLLALYDKASLICLSFNIRVSPYRVYACFNEWDERYKQGVGNYCWYRMIEWLEELGIKEYDLGPLDEDYKKKFINATEPTLGVALIDEKHPLVKQLNLSNINQI